MWTNSQFPGYFSTFTKEILMNKFIFCAVVLLWMIIWLYDYIIFILPAFKNFIYIYIYIYIYICDIYECAYIYIYIYIFIYISKIRH